MRVGYFGWVLAPGYGHCERCKTPWKFVAHHTVWPTPSQGFFVLCEQCWDECDPEERVTYYLGVRLESWPEIGPAALREAVLKG